MQTILGAGGAIGNELAKALTKYTDQIRLVSRNPLEINPGDELISADLTNKDDVFRAVKNSEIVYLTVGLPYRLKVWKETWPVLMKNVVNACIHTQAKLVFFDNVYMYDPRHINNMTEDTPVGPTSQKGLIRRKIAQMLLNEFQKGDLQAMIARSADFYGPSIKNTSVLTEMVIKNLMKGKKGIWLGSPDCKHSFTFTPDAGKATALLGNTPDAYNQVWHLPTAKDPLTGREWVTTIANTMGIKPRFRTMNSLMVRLLGLFVPIIRELSEMMYQYDRDYIFDSSKFEQHFDFTPTGYLEGINNIVTTEKFIKECIILGRCDS